MSSDFSGGRFLEGGGGWQDFLEALEGAQNRPAALGAVDMPEHLLGRLRTILGPWLRGSAPFPEAALDHLARVAAGAPDQSHAFEQREAERWLTPESREVMAMRIAETNGRECCFVLALEADGRYGSPKLFARGNRGRVTAPPPLKNCLTIHNHPSGVVEPSDQDVDAARLWCLVPGAGFGVIDNLATRLTLVVPPIEHVVEAPQLVKTEPVILQDASVGQPAECPAGSCKSRVLLAVSSGGSADPVHSLATAFPSRGLVDA